MLTKCVNCGFYVKRNDVFCLNCGLHNPSVLYESEKFNFKQFLPSQIIFFTGIFIVGLYIAAKSALTTGSVLICAFFSLIISSIFAFIWSTFVTSNKNIKQSSPPKDALRLKEKIIEKRVAELGKRERKIIAVLDKIKETDSQTLQDVRRKLLAAREIVLSQFARYELQRQKIELVRLQNGITPYLYGIHYLNDFEAENGLVTIEISQADIARMRQSLTSDAAIEFPKQTQPERQNFLVQLAETQNSCEHLREALLSRQAARALQDISPLEENLMLPGAKELVHAAESFNIQTTLTDFSESFEELEREYKRLRAEEEVGQKLLES